MNQRIIGLSVLCLCLFATASSQIPLPAHVRILRAEDSRRFSDVEPLLDALRSQTRERAVIAAGRIGDEAAIVPLLAKLKGDDSVAVRRAAAFAIGEIESTMRAAELMELFEVEKDQSVRARIIEAAGKIAAANPTNALTPALKQAILDTLKSQTPGNIGQDEQTVLLALTAALRARPEGAEELVARFLDSSNSRIVADAANALSRLRAKNANEKLRRVLTVNTDGVARSNAARALGAAEDKGAYDVLLKAIDDRDSRVRVSAIRSLASIKDARAAEKLIAKGRAYVSAVGTRRLLGAKTRKSLANPEVESELLEIATALGRLLANTEDKAAIVLLEDIRRLDDYASSETEIAFARVAPNAYLAARPPTPIAYRNPNSAAAYAQGLAAIAELKSDTLNAQAGEKLTAFTSGMAAGVRKADQAKMLTAMPEMTRALAVLTPDNLDDILRGQLRNDDLFIRAAAAGLIADRPVTKANVDALKSAAASAAITDKFYDDAYLGIIDALHKLDKKESVGVLINALQSPNFLVRKRALTLLRGMEANEFPGVPSTIERALKDDKDKVLPYAPIAGSRLGQVLNTDADYRRAISRKNGTVKAVLATEKGTFTIEFFPEDAPLTVDNFVKLARARYFDGLAVHRVVPNFVMQDGDPRGDGNGGPGWSIRCEMNMRPYDRGAVGMALSGKDTGGSQWFVTHSPQPHLDGGYTVFGRVSDADMKVVDRIVRGDRILSVRITERNVRPTRRAISN